MSEQNYPNNNEIPVTGAMPPKDPGNMQAQTADAMPQNQAQSEAPRFSQEQTNNTQQQQTQAEALQSSQTAADNTQQQMAQTQAPRFSQTAADNTQQQMAQTQAPRFSQATADNAQYGQIQAEKPQYGQAAPNVTYSIPLLQLNDLCKRYPGMGTYMSVFHMNLIIPRGRIVGLLGPNGCGKTTLIKMINGLLIPTSGNVLINGCLPCADTKRVISYLPERTYLDNGMKVSEMVSYFCDFYEDFSAERAYGMLSSLGINTEARLKTLSKGTKEKVQLILVMSRQADLYILDEPIAGVDPAARDYILRTIISNYNPNSTILLSTHLISDIENVLDDVIFMKNGSLMLYTSVDSIRGQMGKSVDTYFREVYAC